MTLFKRPRLRAAKGLASFFGKSRQSISADGESPGCLRGELFTPAAAKTGAPASGYQEQKRRGIRVSSATPAGTAHQPIPLAESRKGKKAPPSRPLVETVESRTLFAVGGPSLVGEALLGSAESVTGVVLTFNQRLNAASAQDVNSYAIGRHVNSGSDDSSILGGLFPFAGRAGQSTPSGLVLHPDRKGVHHGRVAFTSAVYDDSTMSVTLTPSYPIKATRFFRYVHVSGVGQTAVTNTAGLSVSGDNLGAGNIRMAFKAHQGKAVHYLDGSGNKITLNLKGPGKIVAFIRTGPQPEPIVLLDNTNAAKSTLTASINPAPGNAATTPVQELLGISNCNAASITANPAYTIAAVEP